MKCRVCPKEFIPIDPEHSRTFHANQSGFCGELCEGKWGANYDADLTH